MPASSGAVALIVPSALVTTSWRMPATMTPSPLAISTWRPGARAQVGITRSSPARSRRPDPAIGCSSRARRTLEAMEEEVGGALDRLDDLADRVATMVQPLHDRADENREEKCDDQRRDGTSQRRLGGEQPPISGLGDRLS